MYFNKNYKLFAIDLSQKKALGTDPKSVLQIDFIRNLDQAGNTSIFFFLEEEKETITDFSQKTVNVLKRILLNHSNVNIKWPNTTA